MMKEKIKKIFRKTIITVSTFMMVCTSSFNAMTTVHAASDNPYFEMNMANEVITEAKKHLGKPYIWGAAGPNSFDCSGYLSYVFKQVGLKFNADRFTTNSLESYFDNMSVTNYRYSTNEGMPANAKKGDIIFYYDSTGDPMHMGLYMGDGQIIHCAASMPSGPQDQVMISNVDALGSKHGTSIVSYKVYRVFEDEGGIRLNKTDEFGNSLSGVVFKITFPDGSERQVTTNANGVWDSDEEGLLMIPGSYKYQEVSTKEGYLLDPIVRSFTVKAGVKASENVVVITNKEPSGQIKTVKTNTNKDSVANTTFKVYANQTITNKAGSTVFYTKDQLVDTITTNTTGEAITKRIPLGSYRVVESKVPDNYVLNSQVFNVDLKYKDQVTELISSSITIVNEEQLGKIQLKKDFDTSLVNGNIGDATLNGNEYMLYANERITNAAGTIVYYEKNQMVSTKVTNANGEIEWDNLPLGKYVIEEIKTNGSLQLNPKKIDVSINYAGQTVKKTVVNKSTSDLLNMQKIQIFKTMHEGGSGVMEGLKGVEFTIKLKSDVEKYGWINSKTYDIITTDENGYAQTKYLPYGIFQVRETKSKPDTNPAPDFTISITKNYTFYKPDEQVRKVSVNNTPLSAQVKLVKEDKDTGEKVTLNSASFKIKDSKGNYVVQKVGGVKIDTFTTNSKNQIVSIFGKQGEVTLPLKLKADSYTIDEIKVPSGFLQLESPVKFEIKNIHDMEMDEEQEPLITVKIKNVQPKGQIEIIKTDKVSGSALKDVEYTLYAKKDIISAIDGSVLFKAGEVVQKNKTNTEGKILMSNIFMGEYILKESLTNEGYVLSKKVHDVVFTQKDMTTKVYKVAIGETNIAPTGEIHLVKTDKETNAFLGGVIYQLTAKEDVISLDGRNTVLYKAGDSVSVDISENGRYMTNELGEINIAGLPLGKYEMKEIYALDDYVADKKVYEIDLSYDHSEKVIYTQDINLTNIAPTGEIHLVKTDKDTNEFLGGVIYQLTALEDIISLDGRNTVLYKAGDSVSVDISEDGHYMTNELGEVNIAGLPLGAYLLKEVNPLDGYYNDVNEYVIDLTYDASEKVIYSQELSLTNSKTITEITKTDITGEQELEGATLSLFDMENNLVESWTSTKEAHVIRGLKFGMKYRLHEDLSPIGYVTASDITFTIDESGKPTQIIMKDDITKVEVSKVDEVSNEQVVGAEMVILEKETKKEIAKWTTDGKAYLIEGLEVGKDYILHEAKAPAKYKLAKDIEFTVEDTKEIQTIIMKDARMPIEGVQTGDQTMLLPIIAVLVGSGIAAIILFKKIKK